MEQPAKPINIEHEKRINTRIAIGIAAFGIACGIFLYIAMFAIMFAFPFAMFKIIPMPSIRTDMVSVEGKLILITGEIDFSGASFTKEPKEKTLMRTFDGEKLSEPAEIEPYGSLDIADGKAYFFYEGGYRVFDGVTWEEFDNPTIGRNPKGTVAPDGIWVLSEYGGQRVLTYTAGSTVEQVPLPPEMDEAEQTCSLSPRLIWAGGGLNLFWKKEDALFHDRYDGTSWSRAGVFNRPDSYEVVEHGLNIYLFTHDVGSAIQTWHFDGMAWSGPRGLGIGQGSFVLDFDVADFGGRPAIITQSFFSEKLYLLGEGGAIDSISLRSPLKVSFTSKILFFNGGFFAFTALFVFVFSTVINRYKLRYWPLKRGRVYFASIFRRFVAHSIDSVIISLPLVALGFLASGMVFPPEDPFMFFGIVVLLIGGFLIWAYLYYSLLEGLWGRTLGKWICGIGVIRDNFTKCGLGRAFLRNLLRVVDAMFYYFVALVTIGATLKWQRLGDIAAGTVVVRMNRRRRRQLRTRSPRAGGQGRL